MERRIISFRKFDKTKLSDRRRRQGLAYFRSKNCTAGAIRCVPGSQEKVKINKKIDIGVGRIDVFDNSQLSVAISKLSPLCVDANQQIAIQKVQSQISAKRSIEASKELLNLTEMPIISVILAIVGNNDSDKAIKELAKVDKS